MKKLNEMTLKEKIGQLIVCGFKSPYYDEQIEELVEDYSLGNVILFSRNFINGNQMKELNKEIYSKIVDKVGLIPFIAIDQEGGQVTRLFKDATFPPSQMTLGATSINGSAKISGRVIANDMIRMGINWDLAPCLEINDELKNFLTNVRSFGSNKEKVSALTKDFISGLSEYGVMSTLKHFPGSGDSNVDSHLDLPVLNTPLEELMDKNLYPFINNLESDSIMTSHLLFKAIDDKYPITLSKKVIKGLIREKMGYTGLIVTDGIEMKAIKNYFTSPRGAVMALKSGADLVLACHELDEQKEIFEAVYEAVRNGELTEEELDEKLVRIIKAKEKMIPYLKKYFFNEDRFIEDINNSNEISKIVDNSITLVNGKVPFIKKDTLIFTSPALIFSEVEDEFSERDLKEALNKEFDNEIIRLDKDFIYDDKIVDLVRNKGDIIFATYDVSKNQDFVKLINEVIDIKKDKSYVISLKGPMEGVLFKGLANYTVMYEYTPNSVKSIIKYLKGEIKPLGKLPL